jgi:hypothetical protein
MCFGSQASPNVVPVVPVTVGVAQCARRPVHGRRWRRSVRRWSRRRLANRRLLDKNNDLLLLYTASRQGAATHHGDDDDDDCHHCNCSSSSSTATNCVCVAYTTTQHTHAHGSFSRTEGDDDDHHHHWLEPVVSERSLSPTHTHTHTVNVSLFWWQSWHFSFLKLPVLLGSWYSVQCSTKKKVHTLHKNTGRNGGCRPNVVVVVSEEDCRPPGTSSSAASTTTTTTMHHRCVSRQGLFLHCAEPTTAHPLLLPLLLSQECFCNGIVVVVLDDTDLLAALGYTPLVWFHCCTRGGGCWW